jgi:signal transduction histidine kinase
LSAGAVAASAVAVALGTSRTLLRPLEARPLDASAYERVARERSQQQAVLGGLMHDLKTPLVAQALLFERLDGSSDEDRQLIMSELKRSSIGAVVRLNRLIDVLRVDHADASGQISRVDVRALADDVVADLAPLIASRQVEVSVTGAWTASLDREALHRALENVAANAVRYASARVDLEVAPWTVRVRDDGPGFAVPFERLLDPFQAGPPDATRPSGTAGLGLYVARRSLEATGGRLALASPGPGGTVVVLHVGGGASWPSAS